jgi:membrane-associated phospholipid phosphatase
MMDHSKTSGQKTGKIKQFFKEYKRIWLVSYIIPYLIWFVWLEVRDVPTEIHIMECSLDQRIPFCEYFIIPYMLWFAYIVATWFYLCFFDKKGFYQFITFLYSGMTLFLIISTIFPNGLNLRVNYDVDKNIFTRITAFLQATDTPTNVFPSIHVYNSIGACVALWKNEAVKKRPILKALFLVLTVSICLSTVFLKQHSLVDVTGGLIMSGFFYWLAYIYLPRRAVAHTYVPVSEH